jgi:N-acetyl-1-D-myo-inositol-2-amino-2-deoxy-alpha-D-glucopyranoside deacetylase
MTSDVDAAATAAPPRGLLAIFAHPDDESFGVGGVLALAAARGVPPRLGCATDGDLGGAAGARALDRELRRGELRDAMAALGVPEPIFLGYGDSGMENWPRPADFLATADAEEVVGRLESILAEVRPAVVLTFDPGGIYGHPDHVTISARATEAYRRAAARPGGPSVLYHQAIPRSGLAEMGRLQEALAERAGSATPAPPSEDDLLQQRRFVELARPDEEVTTIVDVRSALDRKLAALAAHASQMREGGWPDAPREMVEQFLGWETFVLVDPPPLPGERETDLRGVV